MSEDKFYDYSFVKIYLDNKEKYKTLQNFLENMFLKNKEN